jgi:hypothetical protein
VLAQGKHRYYSLDGRNVAAALEALSVVAGQPEHTFVTNTPSRLRAARTCYDHMAGKIAVQLHDRLIELGWLITGADGSGYEVTGAGAKTFALLGIDLDVTRALRRRFARPCLDWSERRPHLAGALGAAILKVALKKRWITQELNSRVLNITLSGRRELKDRFGLNA